MAEGAFIKFNPPGGVGPTMGYLGGWGGVRAEREGKEGWSPLGDRRHHLSEPADKQCFQTREQGGSNGKVFFSRPALPLSDDGGGGCRANSLSRKKH